MTSSSGFIAPGAGEDIWKGRGQFDVRDASGASVARLNNSLTDEIEESESRAPQTSTQSGGTSVMTSNTYYLKSSGS
jgi:hypothetical protein